MKAVVIHAAGDLRVDDLPPEPLAPDEVRVRVAVGGICGSDLHYYRHGGFGAVRLREPMVLGHEIAGTVVEAGSSVDRARVGQNVAVNPSRACGRCAFCLAGLGNHCSDMRFFGSAMRFPHVQGGFRESLTCAADQAVPVPDGVSLAEAALAEPLAVCLHAARQAGSLLGRRVLVTGAGPIGVLLVAVARRAGAAEVIVTDVLDAPLRFARQAGADRTVDVGSDPDALRELAAGKGSVDVMFEASGSGVALRTGLDVVGPRGVIVQVGQGAEARLPMSLLVTKELELKGTFRFGEEFATAVSFIAGRLVEVRPLLSDPVPLTDALRAFDLACDKDRSMKVQLAF